MATKQLVKCIINQKPLKAVLIEPSLKLNELRVLLQLQNSVFFTVDNFPIEKDNEKDISVYDIMVEKTVSLIQEEEKQEQISFMLNNEIYSTANIKLSTTLSDAKKQNNINSFSFLIDGVPVDQNSEKEITIQDIQQNFKVYIFSTVQNEEEKNNNNKEKEEVKSRSKEKKKVKSNNKKKEEDKSLDKKKKEKKINIVFNKDDIQMHVIDITLTLDKVRDLLEFEDTMFFLQDGTQIGIKSEKHFTVQQILNDNNEISAVNKGKSKKDEEETKTYDPQDIENKSYPMEGAELLPQQSEAYGIQIYKYPKVTLNSAERIVAKVLMVVGQTGSGKTTLLNGLINYHLGIKFTDTFRYMLIVEQTGKSQSQSQTSRVTEYHIKGNENNPPLIIVDSPGFGDTRGLEFDQTIVAMIRSFFETKIEMIHAICFVAQASSVRLTASQKYIFTEVLKLYGRDVAENFVCMITFCDGSEPPILEGLQSSDSPFREVKFFISQPWYLKFNNSAIYQRVYGDYKQDEFTKMFWTIGMDSFQQFYEKKLKFLKAQSLTMTKEVLKLRQNLEIQIQFLKQKNDLLINHQNRLQDQIQFIANFQGQIDANQNFTIVKETPIITKIDLAQSQYVTNCTKCNITCHYLCAYSDDDDKQKCYAMKDGFCTICINKCSWQTHKNMSFYFKVEIKKEQGRADNLYSAYIDAKSNKSKSEQILEGLYQEQNGIELELVKISAEVTNLINSLNKNALKAGVLDSTDQYIDEMILSEKNEMKHGWQKRVEQMLNVKKNNQLMAKAYKGGNSIPQYIDYIVTKQQDNQKKSNKGKSWFQQIFTF